MRILVAEDERILRTIITETLTQDGHEVTAVASAEEALEQFRKGPFPIVITDVVMEEMTGLELLDELKAIHPDIIVIVMTSLATVEVATTALRSGAYDFLIKPFEDLGVFSAVVGRACEKVRLENDNLRLIVELKKNAEEMERLNVKLQEMAHRDGLTGLYNHRYFRDALNMELSRARRHQREFSLIFCDVDHFKNYNDTHGHLAGDRVLKDLAGLLNHRTRATTTVARYGGEEFVLLLPETDKEGAVSLAEALRQIVADHPFEVQDTQPGGSITISVGVATFPADGQDAPSLIEHADRALYAAKGMGRNKVSV